jgi:phosphoserine phosphatase
MNTHAINLILQAPAPNLVSADLIKQIATLIGCTVDTTAEIQTSATVCRFHNVQCEAPIRKQVEQIAAAARLDATFITAGQRLEDFKLVVMDMDSTLITIECIDEIADMQGLKSQVSAITEAAMRGEIEFRESLQQRVALLKGLDATALQRVIDERLQLSPGAEVMLKAVKEAGCKTLLVSGGFTFFTEHMQARLGLDYTCANQLDIQDGKLTGKILGNIIDAQAKRRTVEATCVLLNIEPAQTIVMGDGANDLAMMAIAGLSVAYKAKPIVQQNATVSLNFVGLDGILALFDER